MRGEKGTSRPYLRGQVWWIRYATSEGERRESSGSANKADAQKLLRERLRESESGRLQLSDVLVGNLLDLYLAERQKNKYANIAICRINHLRPAFGKLSAAELTTQAITRFIDGKLAAGYAKATINRCLEALRRSYTLGYQNVPRLIHEVPRIPMLDESDNVREGFLGHEQYVAMRGELPMHLKTVLVIGYHLGMRRGEILSLRWDQVDWATGVIRLDKKQTKGKTARVAPMFGELRSWLEAVYQQRQSDHIIEWHGHSIGDIKGAWSKATVRAGVEDLLVHDLRRTAVRNMVRAGISEKVAMLISGHKTRSMFARYDIVNETDIVAAGKQLEGYLAASSAQVSPVIERDSEARRIN